MKSGTTMLSTSLLVSSIYPRQSLCCELLRQKHVWLFSLNRVRTRAGGQTSSKAWRRSCAVFSAHDSGAHSCHFVLWIGTESGSPGRRPTPTNPQLTQTKRQPTVNIASSRAQEIWQSCNDGTVVEPVIVLLVLISLWSYHGPTTYLFCLFPVRF
jgi:hypothetical protein